MKSIITKYGNDKESSAKHAVELKFPNVRIHLQDIILREKLPPSQAMAQGAVYFGLIDEEASVRVIDTQVADLCLCMASGASIVEEYFKRVPQRSGFSPVDCGQVLADIFSDARTHFKAIESLDHLGEIEMRTHDCCKFTPILFDLMLQQLLRYPGL